MKVACIGAMNHIMFSMVRYLRDAGVDAHLLVTTEDPQHFYPEADSFDRNISEFCHRVSWGLVHGFYDAKREKISSDLSSYDYLIGCGSSPAFVEKAGRVMDVFVPYGFDLYSYPFFKLTWPSRQIQYLLFSMAQRKGIQKARRIHMDDMLLFEKYLEWIQPQGQRVVLGLPIVYSRWDEISGEDEKLSHWARKFRAIRDQSSLLVFHHTRHVWKRCPDPMSLKGNHRLIWGFCDYLRESNDFDARLVCFEYGSEVTRSKELVKSLGIEDQVAWFPLMERKHLMLGLALADVGAAEFHWSWINGGTIFETIAAGKALITYRDEKNTQNHYRELYPIFNAREPETVSDALRLIRKDPSYARQMGRDSMLWYRRHVVDPFLDFYLGFLK